jgi:NTE family protein
MLVRGLVRPAIETALQTAEGPKALACFALIGVVNSAFLCLSSFLWLVSQVAPAEYRKTLRLENWHPPVRRFASRSTSLRRAIDTEFFKGARLRDLKSSKPLLIVCAAELRTGSAFYFSANESGSWRLGRLALKDISIAHAVAASAAYPLLLPALDEIAPFDRRDGSRRVERISLTDGGVYDSLGLAPLWPDRDLSISLNVKALDTIICCRAGYGLRHDPPSQFMIARLKSAFACVQDRAENSGLRRLFDLRKNGSLSTVVISFLGQDDHRLKFAPVDLVTREQAYAYPTDFSAMSPVWIERLSRRGEQITRAIIEEHAPQLAGGAFR